MAVTAPVTQTSSIAHLSTDPLRNFKFIVTLTPPTGTTGTGGVSNGVAGSITGPVVLGFMSISGLNMTVDVIAYREGGYNTTTQKMPGQADFSPITFSRGVALAANAATGYQWISELFVVMQGTGTTQPGTDFRWIVDIQVLDHPVTAATVPVKAWFRVYNAWPTSMAWSDLDAGANQLFIEQMVLAHEGFSYTVANAIGSANAATPA
jgi:phage tail-like protein